ncbi:Phosphate transporter PHO1 like protein 3 [Cucumispora dikerogammari]|nr:Phosphate transporter PHO1 like protein 3 [Cucumispora dikerogammari]
MPLFDLEPTPTYKYDRFQTWRKMYINLKPCELLLNKINKPNKELIINELEKQLRKFLKSYLLLELNTHHEKEEFLLKICRKNNLIPPKGDAFPTQMANIVGSNNELKKNDTTNKLDINDLAGLNKLDASKLVKITESKQEADFWNIKLWAVKYSSKNQQKTLLNKIKSYYTHKPYARKYLELSKILNRVLEFKKENTKRIYNFLLDLLKHDINISFDEIINRDPLFSVLIKTSLLDKDLIDLRNIYGIFFEKNKEKRSKIFKAIKEGSKNNPALLHLSGVFTVFCFYFLLKIFKTTEFLGVGLIGLYLNAYLCALSIYIYDFYKINYTYLLEMAEYNRFDLSHTLFFSSSFFLIISLGLYFNNLFQGRYLIWPIILLPFIVLLIPYGFIYERKYILQSILKIITLNLLAKKIRLPDFFYADYYNSIAPFFGYLFFHIFTKTKTADPKILGRYVYIFILHASLLRIYQCILRFIETKNTVNLFNGLKYILNLSTASFNTFLDKELKLNFSIILMFRIISAFYTLYWDFIVDWLFFSQRKCLFKKPFYFFIGVFDVLLRLWPVASLFYDKLSVKITIWTLFFELVRRGLWGIIRLECEYLNNLNGFSDSHFFKVNSLAEFYYKNYKTDESDDTETDDCLDTCVETDLYNPTANRMGNTTDISIENRKQTSPMMR